MKKRFLSLMLAVAMCAGLISGFCVTAYAADKTQEEAIEWVKQQLGKSLDYDGAYGAQCVDLIKYYYVFLGENAVTGNGGDYATNALPEGWTRTKGGTPQKGDILVYSARGGKDTTGHVAIYESDESIYHQNYGYSYVTQTKGKYDEIRDGSYWGCIHPDFNDSISLGDYVQMGTYYGEPILWRCVAFEKISGYDDAGYPIIDSTDTVTEYQEGYLPLLLSDKIICLKPFDAATSVNSYSGSHSRDRFRGTCGSNCWYDSNIRAWLNSSANAGGVTWLCGNPPSEEHVYDGYNDFDKEAGFLTNFTQSELEAIQSAVMKSIVGYGEWSNGVYDTGTAYYTYDRTIYNVVQNYSSAYAQWVTDSFFLLDSKQINTVYNNGNVLGSTYYIGEPTAQCVTNTEVAGKSLKTDSKWSYWLRTPLADEYDSFINVPFNSTRVVDSDGNIYSSSTNYGGIGVRPAVYLTEEVSLNGQGTIEEPYTIAGISVYLDGEEIQFDQPPVMVDDRVMVPIRAILEAMGYIVAWDEETQTASALGGSTYIVIQVDNNVITYTRNADTYTYECDVPPQVISDRTLVPIRAVAECLGCTVEWDEASQNVIITSAS